MRVYTLYPLTSILLALSKAQESGWQPNQINATMCQWVEPRAAVIRDMLYLDGGYLWWKPGFEDGTYGAATEDGNPYGLIYTLNFSVPFNTSMNTSQVFSKISKAPNSGAANNFAPNYYDGAMFANDYEWFTYGGVLAETNEFSPPDAHSVLGYQAYWYGAPGKSFAPGFVQGTTPTEVTRYVTGGSEVSVPSENLAFYFGGLRSNSSGPIYGSPASANESYNADVLSTAFITLDMENQGEEAWTNDTLPTNVPGRVNAELVWVPVGKRGVLIAIGGVVDPVFANANRSLSESQAAKSMAESPNFMTTVAVYDIDTKHWYMQPTNSGSPPPLTQGCAVVASSTDYTSHNIYWYGGFDGINQAKTFNDDVWILSIPSFMWMRVLQGTNGHGRAGHKCIKPYPDQMMVIGGYTPLTGTELTCVQGGVIQLLNLSSAEWLNQYSPGVWSNYSVPGMIYNMIGGTALGGANMFPPSWANQSMSTLFATSYNISKLTKWYPYGNATLVDLMMPMTSTSGLPSWVAPVVGTIGGLIVIGSILTCWILYKRKKYLQAQGASQDASRYKVLSWMRGAPEPDSTTVTTEGEQKSPFDDVESAAKVPIPIEAASTQVFEMPDNAVIQEMGDTGMSYLPSAAPLPGGRPNGLKSHPSSASRVSKLSTLSSSPSTPGNSPSKSIQDRTVSPLSKAESIPRADSPSLGIFGSTQPRVQSGISSLGSETPRIKSPMSLSDPFTSDDDGETIKSVKDKEVSPTTPPPKERKKSVAGPGNYISGPVSPPTPMRDEEGADYLTGLRSELSEPSVGRSPSRKAKMVLGIPDKSVKGEVEGKEKTKEKRKSVFGEMLDDE